MEYLFILLALGFIIAGLFIAISALKNQPITTDRTTDVLGYTRINNNKDNEVS